MRQRKEKSRPYNWKKHVKAPAEVPGEVIVFKVRLSPNVKFFCQLVAKGVGWDRALEQAFSRLSPQARNRYIQNYIDTKHFQKYLYEDLGYMATLSDALRKDKIEPIEKVKEMILNYTDPAYCELHKIPPVLRKWAAEELKKEADRLHEEENKKGAAGTVADEKADFKKEVAEQMKKAQMTSQSSAAEISSDL